jgi:hypothetical protein
MDSLTSNSKITRRAAKVLFALFLLFLWLPTVDTFLKLDRAPAPNEKRVPAKFPVWQGGDRAAQAYITGLEAYFNDHFGYRKRLIRWNNRWRHNWFHEATHPDVAEGRDGWLYFLAGRMLAHYQQGENFAPQDLQDWQTLLETRRDWLARHGSKFVFVIPPDKHTIYPEHLPTWITKSAKPTKLDQFVEHMKAHSTVVVVDLRPALLAAKTNAPTYLTTDSHWNAYGGYIGYQEIIKALAAQISGQQPVPLTAFQREASREHPDGDLAVMMGVENKLKEKNYVAYDPLPPLMPLEKKKIIGYQADHWKPALEPFWQINPSGLGRAVVFHDSFGQGFMPFLGYNFRETAWVWQPFLSSAFIEDNHPDIVIEELLERMFNTIDPREEMKKEALK